MKVLQSLAVEEEKERGLDLTVKVNQEENISDESKVTLAYCLIQSVSEFQLISQVLDLPGSKFTNVKQNFRQGQK